MPLTLILKNCLIKNNNNNIGGLWPGSEATPIRGPMARE